MNNQSSIQNSQPTTTSPCTTEPPGPVPAPAPRQARGIPAPPLSAAVSIGSKVRVGKAFSMDTHSHSVVDEWTGYVGYVKSWCDAKAVWLGPSADDDDEVVIVCLERLEIITEER